MFPKEVNVTTEETIKFGLTAEETVQEIRHRIYLATQLTASAGIACNMRLAKLCSGKLHSPSDESTPDNFRYQ